MVIMVKSKVFIFYILSLLISLYGIDAKQHHAKKIRLILDISIQSNMLLLMYRVRTADSNATSCLRGMR